MNNVQLVGKMTRDPEVKYSTGEKATANCRFNVAVNRKYKNKDTGQYDADFINCVAFGQTAEFVGKYFHKGDGIGVIGEIRTGSYTNKDGNKVYTTDIYANNIEFVGGKGTNDNTKIVNPNVNVNVPEDVDDQLPW